MMKKAIIFLCLFQTVSNFSTVHTTDFKKALTLVQNHQYQQGLELLLQLAEQQPNNPTILYNTAYTFKQLGYITDAIPFYERAIALNPENGPAHLGLAKAYLATGNFTDGWQAFEYRMANQKKYRQEYPFHNLTLEDLKGKTVLLKAEWGFGDMMQFLPRYAQVLKEAGVKKIIAHTFNPLVQLFALCPYIDQAISLKEPATGYDTQIPALSLPLLCSTTVDSIPADIPYLQADPNLVAYWAQELKKVDGNQKLRIGLCWQAKPGIFLENNPLTRRSIPLERFAPLAQLEHVQLYSLHPSILSSRHKGLEEHSGSALRADSNLKWLHQFGPDFDKTNGRFMDTAAVIENLDLIISVDTAIVHLAGALGAPVWVLLPSVAEWRWQLHQTETPWYPNVRLFRKKKEQTWSDLIATIKELLCTL